MLQTVQVSIDSNARASDTIDATPEGFCTTLIYCIKCNLGRPAETHWWRFVVFSGTGGEGGCKDGWRLAMFRPYIHWIGDGATPL